MSLPVAVGNMTETQDTDMCPKFDGALPQFLGRLLYTSLSHCQELMPSVGSHGNLSLLFMMKLMV